MPANCVGAQAFSGVLSGLYSRPHDSEIPRLLLGIAYCYA